MTAARRAADPAECQHRVRTRENNSGFASPETVCVSCGQVFDAEREQELRALEHARPADRHDNAVKRGYIVG